ncbi:MAG: hypothetical protein IJR15_03885 [Clostridiales bacterium]|nr:hypothetical protein [Clostridiales bacterium]
MQGRNAGLYVIILGLTVMAILFMMYQTRRIEAGLHNSKVQQNTEELTAELNQLDYEIYWIGELPQYMDGIREHVTLISASGANSSVLPVVEGDMGFTEYDENGRIVNHIEQRHYAPYMMIVINTSEELSDTAWAAVQDCAVNNHVPVLLIGDNNINAFRSYMILVAKDYDANSSLFFEITREAQDNPIDPEAVANGGHAYADALLTFIHDTLIDPSVVYITPAPEQTIQEIPAETEQPSLQETVTAETQETSDAA